MRPGQIAVVGAAETSRLGVLPELSTLELHAEASLAAIADAGLTPADIDGITSARPIPTAVADRLGIKARWLDGTAVGGGSFMLHVRHAAAAIAAGHASAVLISHGESGRSRVGMDVLYDEAANSARGQFEMPYGALPAYAAFTPPVLRFLHDRGMSRTDLAEVVVAQRRWAAPNPRAARRDETTVDEVLGGKEVAYPFTRDMCCVVTDGGGAVVLTSAERAADLRTADRPVYLLGAGEANGTSMVSQMDDLGSFAGFRTSAQEAFHTAGIQHSDVDHLMGYDAFAHLPLYMLEDLGFVGRGESGAFIAEGHTSPGGRLPMNTNGGGLNYTHTGMYGMFAILEAVRQLRREACQQVPGVTISFVQGIGGFFRSAGSLVLSNRQP